MKATRATRIKAAELAAQCVGVEIANGGAAAARIMALVIFFEIYITEGADATEKAMHLLAPRKRGKLKVVAGGNLR